jgi:hypothetical protein
MSETALADVGQTLIDLLREQLNDLVNDAQEIALISPEEAKNTDIRLALFLYSIVEVPELKNQGELYLSSSQTQYPPLAVNLYYLLTAFSPGGGQTLTNRTLEAHRLLGAAMRVFYDNGILTGTKLKGNLKKEDELRVTLQPITVEDLTRIWGVFPDSPYRTSVSYLVTPVAIDSERRTSTRRVTVYQSDYDQLIPNRT